MFEVTCIRLVTTSFAIPGLMSLSARGNTTRLLPISLGEPMLAESWHAKPSCINSWLVRTVDRENGCDYHQHPTAACEYRQDTYRYPRPCTMKEKIHCQTGATDDSRYQASATATGIDIITEILILTRVENAPSANEVEMVGGSYTNPRHATLTSLKSINPRKRTKRC